MDNFLTTLQQRRTIRRYKSEPLSQEKLEKVLQAAQCAQSWNNTQCWELVLITDREVRKNLQATVPSKNPAFNAIVNSAVLICVCARTKLSGYFGNEPGTILGDWFMHDIGIMTQNLCNQVMALGLGTAVVGWLDHAAAKKILYLPEGFELVSLIPLGYPDQQPRVTARKNFTDFVHENRFGKRFFD
jgi:nitroreductase